MENEIIGPVLTEILEQQKEIMGLLLEAKKTLNSFELRLEGLEQPRAIPAVFNDTQKQLSDELRNIKSMMVNLPVNTTHEKRILLFPEHHAKDYYSTVLRWVLYIIIATYSYWIVKFAIGSFIN